MLPLNRLLEIGAVLQRIRRPLHYGREFSETPGLSRISVLMNPGHHELSKRACSSRGRPLRCFPTDSHRVPVAHAFLLTSSTPYHDKLLGFTRALRMANAAASVSADPEAFSGRRVFSPGPQRNLI